MKGFEIIKGKSTEEVKDKGNQWLAEADPAVDILDIRLDSDYKENGEQYHTVLIIFDSPAVEAAEDAPAEEEKPAEGESVPETEEEKPAEGESVPETEAETEPQ